MDIENLIKKVEESRDGKLDLSSDEDLSIAVMNLVSIEEHLYFTGMKTGKGEYFALLNEVRDIRKSLLKELVKNQEGEMWCISKHLLGSSMRLIEVGNKHLAKKKDRKAKEMFEKAWHLYSMFWGLNLGLAKKSEIPAGEIYKMKSEYDTAMHINRGFSSKLSDIVKRIIDCCKE